MHIDWLEFTYKTIPTDQADTWIQFLEDFPMFDAQLNDCVISERGMNGYNFVLKYCDEYMIQYNTEDSTRMGVHVVFPGHGMYRLAELFGLTGDVDFVSIKPVFEYLFSHKCRITRLDVAFDDYSKTYLPEDYDRFYLDKRISTRYSQSNRLGSVQNKGQTFYLGRRGRDRMLRVYDKEYESKGKIKAVRYEIEFKHDYAGMLAMKVIRGEKFDFADLLLDMFVIVAPYEYVRDNEVLSRKRKQLAGADPDWMAFIETIRKSCLEVPDLTVERVKKEPSFKRTYNWVNDKLLKTLHIFAESYGYDRFMDLIRSAECRLKSFDIQMINKYKDEVPLFFWNEQDEQDD